MIIKLATDIEPAMELGMQRKERGLKCKERNNFLHMRGKGVCNGLAEDKGEEGGATLPSIKKCSRVMEVICGIPSQHEIPRNYRHKDQL